jgi:predicted LPLAT superfamily acyltransferase
VEVGPETAIFLQSCIDRGEFVVIAGDRTPVLRSDRISRAPFLGHLAPFPQGPYIIASLLKCPVILIFCLKKAGKYHIIFEHFESEISLPRQARAAVLDSFVARYAERLTYYAERHPYQWFNFFDFWNQVSTMRRNDKAEIGQQGREQTSPKGRGLHDQDDR